MIIKNPLNSIELLRIVKRTECVFEPEEAKKFLEVARQTEGGILPAFLLWSGCRPNEGCALQWKDINLDNGTVEIRRNLMRLKGRWEFGPLKRDSGIRTVKLPRDFLDWLKQHRAEQLERRLQSGSIWQDYDLVFTNEIGEPVPETYYRRLWKQIMRAYDARHSTATLLLLQRVPPKVVSRRLGHSSTKITMDVYSHLLERMEEQATDDLERAIKG